MTVVYEYKGGGYDGCWWEWNFFAMHDDEFHDIFSSGRKGLKTSEEATEALSDDSWKQYAKLNEYDLSDARDRFALVNGMAASNAVMVDRYLRYHGMGKLQGNCYECGKIQNVKDMNRGNWTGDGWGVAYFPRDLFCSQACMEAS